MNFITVLAHKHKFNIYDIDGNAYKCGLLLKIYKITWIWLFNLLMHALETCHKQNEHLHPHNLLDIHVQWRQEVNWISITKTSL